MPLGLAFFEDVRPNKKVKMHAFNLNRWQKLKLCEKYENRTLGLTSFQKEVEFER